MNGDVALFRESINKKRAERDVIGSQLRRTQNTIAEKKERLRVAVQTRELLQEVVRSTQHQISVSIGTLVTQALRSVFPDPYGFEVAFVSKRNKTECELNFTRGEHLYEPLETSGGGVVDIASFALRATFLVLKGDQRMSLILDEPFRFVSVDLQPYCSDMLKQISSELGIQIIMISHLPEIIGSADRVLSVEQENGLSRIRSSFQ
jgi:DNA repair ATPase RecN